MKKTRFKEKIQYRMDLLMEKGTATMIIMLLLFTLLALLSRCLVAALPGRKYGIV